VFLNVHRILQENGTFPIVKIQWVVIEGGKTLLKCQHNPQVSTQRICSHLSVLCMRVWRTLNTEGQYPYHIHQIQHLQPADLGRQLEFYHWLTGHLHLHHCILFTGESHFIHSECSNTRPPTIWTQDSPHRTV
jgi:hypothetical protein